ncbi:protein phosphatase 2C-like domain-containing protein 1 [Heptranchias perlo]|uniref:protein phosphatase 2C-like domain-containing protein 1 n=1 Tax=Heptranchias perlo TaxID=212740 RepID=UPI003559604E
MKVRRSDGAAVQLPPVSSNPQLPNPRTQLKLSEGRSESNSEAAHYFAFCSYCPVSTYTPMQEIKMPLSFTENMPSVSQTAPTLDMSPCDLLTVPCLTCNKKMHARSVRHHKALHRALVVLLYRAGKLPVSLLSLRLRRRSIISKRMRSKKWSPLELQKIDFAYELVKSNRMSMWPFISEKPIVCSEEVPLSLELPGDACIKSLGICQDRNALWKSEMEDAYVFVDSYGGQSNTWFIGLFDGFHGMSAAQFASKELPILILEQLIMAGHSYSLSDQERAYLSRFDLLFPKSTNTESHIVPSSSTTAKNKGTKDHRYGSIHLAFTKAFWKMDRMLRLGRNESSKIRWSGCAVTTCLIEPAASQSPSTTEASEGSSENNSEANTCEIGTLHIANAGDVHAILCKNGKGYRLTGNHSTSNRKECKRILQTGGTISKNERHGLVEGLIQSTRGLGYHGDPKLKKYIVPIPYTASVPIDSSCQFLVLASSGFWKVLNMREVVSISLQMLSFYFGSFHTDSKRKENSSFIHSSHVTLPLDEQNIDRRASIIHLLEEFSQEGHEDALMSIERLFEELLIGKKHGSNRESIERLLMHFAVKKEHGTIWKAMHHLLENIAAKEEHKISIENVVDELPPDEEYDSSTSTESLLEDHISNEEHSEDRTSVDNFSEKPLQEVKDNRTSIESFSEELLTKEEYSDDKLAVIRVAEELSPTEELNDHYSQENITKESKNLQNSVSLSSEPIGTSSPERVAIETPYDDAYIMIQGENIEATRKEPLEIQYETLANTISERLVETAKQAGACDNITVLILLLPGCAKSCSVEEQK